MQQYFVYRKLKENDLVELSDDIVYHLVKVLRKTNQEFRLVDSTNSIFLCRLENNKAKVIKNLFENNELSTSITVIMSLIKSDKFELTLQKLTELGVNRIIPYNAYRSIVKETKKDKKLERYKKILTEASEQSHRNFVPEILPAIDIKDLVKYKSELNLVAYEKEEISIKSNFNAKSISIVIGPEGGFEQEEIEKIKELGFKSISLGKRILRAETAAIYLTSIVVGENQ